MTRYKVGFIIWGIFCFVDSLVFLTSLLTKDPSAIIPNAIPFGITIFGTAFNIIKYVRTKKPKENPQNDIQSVPLVTIPTTIPTTIQQTLPVITLTPIQQEQPTLTPISTPTQQEKPTVYVQSRNTISRADGQLISDEEVPYMIEMGYRQALEREQSQPHLSTRDEELEFQFIQKHGEESSRRCEKFENLNRLAYNEVNLNKKIELLQQTIDEFEKTKQWHYNHSKGAKIYFQKFWEQLHNSGNNCFSWIDSVKNELEFQLQKRDEIIPWIIENSKIGFMQTAIYKEFPENGKSDLRKVIDELAIQNIVVKSKKGNSYYISNSIQQ